MIKIIDSRWFLSGFPAVCRLSNIGMVVSRLSNIARYQSLLDEIDGIVR